MERTADRSVRIAAADDALILALSEHRTAREGWRIGPLLGAPEADALVILDLDEPDARCRLVERVRAEGFTGPILIMGEAGDARSPDDEPIARPVRLGTLLARIDAHWAEPADTATQFFGPYQFLPGERVLRGAGDLAIRLTELERKLLVHLAAAAGGLVSREQLLAGVWGYSVGTDTHTVETHIWRLRQKIETDDPGTRFLVTEPGGYRLLMAGSAADG